MGNAEVTKKGILAAAKKEFSTYGIAGARVDRIAEEAGCNKNLIYIYFEDKESLFNTVLKESLTHLNNELIFNADDLADYAGRAFDYAMSNPEHMKLIGWFALEQGSKGHPAREASFESKTAAVLKAQKAGIVSSVFPPNFIISTILAMTTAWSVSNPLSTSLDPKALKNKNVIRENIVKAIKLLTDPTKV